MVLNLDFKCQRDKDHLPHPTDCLENAMLIQGAAQVNGTKLEVERSAALPSRPSVIFADGFESGDTSAWSSSVP